MLKFSKEQYIKDRGVKAAEDNRKLIELCDGKKAEVDVEGTYHIKVGDFGLYVNAGVVEVDNV